MGSETKKDLLYKWNWKGHTVTILLLGILRAIFLGSLLVPFKRKFFIDDPSLTYPYLENTVPFPYVIAIVIVFPTLVIFFLSYFIWGKELMKPIALHFLFGQYESLVLTELITTLIKATIGRHRPHFLELCRVRAGACTAGVPCDIADCTGTGSELEDASFSFPSGHTSVSYAGLFYLTLYLWFALKPHVSGNLYAYVFSFLPTILALWISITRIQDYHHHWTDVLGGTFIGVGFAGFAFYFALIRIKPWFKSSELPK
eukprot:c19929_g2_i2.p1 GENE.c19929_g2_i2~~c19929_g2_i2.p1  ORF type:complete len:258 (+),score=48.05 c19929_g2_i2:88-861(+)